MINSANKNSVVQEGPKSARVFDSGWIAPVYELSFTLVGLLDDNLEVFDHFNPVIQLGFVQNRVSEGISVPRVYTTLYQSLAIVEAADGSSLQQRSIAVLVSHVQVGSVGHQKIEDLFSIKYDNVM